MSSTRRRSAGLRPTDARVLAQSAGRFRGILVGVSVTASLAFVFAVQLVAEAAAPISGSAAPPRIATGPVAPGAQLWVARYSGPGNGFDGANGLAVSGDGSKVFVTGTSVGSTSGYDYATVAYGNSTGAQLWATRYNGPGNMDDVASAIRLSPDGSTVFVTGGSTGSTSGLDYATVAYNATTGAQLWVARYNDSANSDDNATTLGVSPDGTQVLVTGWSGSTSGYDYATVAYNASTGAQLWVTRYNGAANGDDHASALGMSPDGSKVFVTGDSVGLGSVDYATIAYNASTGAQLWAGRYGSHGGGSKARALAVSPDGSRVVVTGSSYRSTSNYDYATVAYNASTGAQQWTKRYNGPARHFADVANALEVSLDGSKVFVTGYSTVSTSGAGRVDYATVAYGASTGAKLWVKRYSGPAGGGAANALGVSRDGSKVFVTGYNLGSTSGYDYATVAYSIT